MNYQPPEQPRAHKYEPHKQLGAYSLTNVNFSKSIIGLKIEKTQNSNSRRQHKAPILPT